MRRASLAGRLSLLLTTATWCCVLMEGASVEMVLASRRQEVLEVLGDGQHQVVRHQGILPDGVSTTIRQSLTSTVGLTVTPESRWWHAHSDELRSLHAEKSRLLDEYRRLGHWQRITVVLACISAGLQGVLAVASTVSEVRMAVTGATITTLGGAFTAILRHLAKEKAATITGLAQANDSAAKIITLAQPMAAIPQFINQSADKFKAIVDIYKVEKKS